ncbi:uncharacterized protein TM35_000252090 [Trypanosoma theileri]|uniref:Uncharacterized protein n=1 Tax=Trypanosoma theileri TaxID=67003 RepID=A0A1X0NQZ9_9TRYP|nr:uncharacterized protein TM35_000252090 [Trypanosoma theileri]ORC86913.1 hypothetical protein TM35_000252090 [Trypanosoma theileri]
MSDVSAVKNRETPDEWLHAANSIAALQTVKTRMMTPYTQTQQQEEEKEEQEKEEKLLGIEVDVRVLPNSLIPILRHDPISVDMDSVVKLTEWLETLAGIVSTQERRIGVVKFDFKDPAAAELSYQLFSKSLEWYKTLRKCFSFWWNADVVMAVTPPTSSNSNNNNSNNSEVSFLSLPSVKLHHMIYTIVDQFGFGLSFGWVLPDGFHMYDVRDIHNMRVFLQSLAAREEKWHSRPSCITFAVRYSAVFGEEHHSNNNNNNNNNNSEKYTFLWQAMDELLQEASCLFTVDNNIPPCFLTFWRGRNESITDEEIAIAKARFPTCTIDVD